MMAVVQQPCYMPLISYFYRMDRADVFIILDNAEYSPTGAVNRGRIKTPQGLLTLTVPVKPEAKPVSRILIDNEKGAGWNRKHWNAVKYSYSRAEYWDFLNSELESFYSRTWQKLMDANMALINLFRGKLGIGTRLVTASELEREYGVKCGSIAGICRLAGADACLVAGGEPMKVQEEAEFEEKGIRVVPDSYTHPVYTQKWGDFVCNLSILDLMLNHGEEAIDILKAI